MAVEIRYDNQVVTVQSQEATVTAIQRRYGVEVESVLLSGGGMPYTGSYVSQPSWERQVYETRGRSMRDDFSVEGIVKMEVANPAGGLTLTI